MITRIQNKITRIFAVLFISTGIFAIAGGLYTWGDGSIFNQNELTKVLIPWADILLTGPLSLICGYGILKKQAWAKIVSLNVSGIYVFGSLLVFINIIWNQNYSFFLIIPAVSGLLIGLGYSIFSLKISKII